MPKHTNQRDAAREPQLKAAVLDALFHHHWIDDNAVVISEMPLPRGDRRADLVLANGKLIGFEIKSGADTTSRLAAQAAAFLEQFEGLVVVVDERHYADAERLLPPAAGIFTSSEIDGRITINIRRKAHVKALDRQASMRLMHTADLQKLARRHRMPTASTSRYALEQAIIELPQHIIRAAAIEAVKRRYRSYFNTYRAHRDASSDFDGLNLLRKPAWRTERTVEASPAVELAPPPTLPVLPIKVIPRTVTQTRRRARPRQEQ